MRSAPSRGIRTRSTRSRFHPTTGASCPAAASNLALIDLQHDAPVRTEIFGSEPAPTWCYYYEKARLAEQAENWEQMITLWDAAVQKGFRPRSQPEFTPFILAAAHTGHWDLAVELTQKAYYPKNVMHDYLCTIWRRARDEVPASPAGTQAIEKTAADLDCRAIFAP